jgi:hypothetical protein
MPRVARGIRRKSRAVGRGSACRGRGAIRNCTERTLRQASPGASILAIGEAADDPDLLLVFPLVGLRAEFGDGDRFRR